MAPGTAFRGRETAGPIRQRGPAVRVRNRLKAHESVFDLDLINSHLDRVEVQEDSIVVNLTCKESGPKKKSRTATVIYIPWRKIAMKRRREILLPVSAQQDVRAIRSETRATLVAAIARGRR